MDSSLETRTGELKGKIALHAARAGERERVDRRADVFAMGVMVWEAAVGRRLWKGLNEVAIMQSSSRARSHHRARSIRACRSSSRRFASRALARRADDRYPTAADFAADLERFLVTIGDRTTTRDIARLVSDAFEPDRRELREIIDGQLRMLRQGDSAASGPMPKLSSAALGGGGTPSVSLAQPSAAQLDRGVAPSYTAGGTASVASVPKRGGVPLIAGALIAAAAAIVGFVVFLVFHHDPRGTPVPISSIDPLSARPNAESVEVTITTNPPAAMLFLDDAPLGPSPFHQTFPRDNLAHRIRVEAQSYGPRTELVVFDKPIVQREIELSKAIAPGVTPTYAPPPPPRPTVVHTATGAPTNPEPVQSGAHKPPRQIDTSFGP